MLIFCGRPSMIYAFTKQNNQSHIHTTWPLLGYKVFNFICLCLRVTKLYSTKSDFELDMQHIWADHKSKFDLGYRLNFNSYSPRPPLQFIYCTCYKGISHPSFPLSPFSFYNGILGVCPKARGGGMHLFALCTNQAQTLVISL